MAEDRQASGSPRLVVEGVARLEQHIETGITRAFPSLFWVEGEVAELRAGHDWLRFLLVQPVDDDLVAVHAFLGRPHIGAIRERVGDSLRRVIATGNTIKVAGRLHYASTSREVELRVERLSSAFRDGLLVQRRREVEAKLKLQGLYDRQRIQLRLPLTPLRVGIVSSTHGHGYSDAVEVLDSSSYAIHHELYRARLEGHGAAESIAAAVRAAAHGDGNQVVLLVRGGGSSVQLAPFDAEPVARAVAEAGVPVVTGIGHQADDTLTDQVAHQRCMTPTQAANFLVGRLHAARSELDQQLAEAHRLASEAAARARRQASLRRWSVATVLLVAAASLLLGSTSVGRVALTVALTVVAVAAAIRLTATRPAGGEGASVATAGLEGILDELRRLQDRLRRTSHPLEVDELTRTIWNLGERGHRLLDQGQGPTSARRSSAVGNRPPWSRPSQRFPAGARKGKP